MKNFASQENRYTALKYLSKTVSDLGGLPFFGTALGIIRNGTVLAQDDDVDFILPVSKKDALLAHLDRDQSFTYTFFSEWIVQVSMHFEGDPVLIDFYFYWDEGDDIRLPWNFYGTPWRQKTHIYVPKVMLSELIFDPDDGFISKGDTIASYLYGEKWNTPLRKSIDYEIDLRENRPQYFYPGPFGRFAREGILRSSGATLTEALKRRFWLLLAKGPVFFVFQILEFKVNRSEEEKLLRYSESEVLKRNQKNAKS
jgi:hypothetical protein